MYWTISKVTSNLVYNQDQGPIVILQNNKSLDSIVHGWAISINTTIKAYRQQNHRFVGLHSRPNSLSMLFLTYMLSLNAVSLISA